MYSTFLSYFIFTFYLFSCSAMIAFFCLGKKLYFWFELGSCCCLCASLLLATRPQTRLACPTCRMLQMKQWWNIHRRCNISPLYDLNLFWQLALLGFVMRLRRFNKISLLFDRFCNLHSTLFALCCCTTREINENRKCEILWNMWKCWLIFIK